MATMQVAIRLPRATAEACRDESLWYEIEAELRDGLLEEPDHFWEHVSAAIEVVSSTADVVTIYIASRELGRLLLRMIERSKRTPGGKGTTITAEGPGGQLSLELSSLTPKAADNVATLLLEIQEQVDD